MNTIENIIQNTNPNFAKDEKDYIASTLRRRNLEPEDVISFGSEEWLLLYVEAVIALRNRTIRHRRAHG